MSVGLKENYSSSRNASIRTQIHNDTKKLKTKWFERSSDLRAGDGKNIVLALCQDAGPPPARLSLRADTWVVFIGFNCLPRPPGMSAVQETGEDTGLSQWVSL